MFLLDTAVALRENAHGRSADRQIGGSDGHEPPLTVCSLAPRSPGVPVPASLCGRWAPQSASGSSLVRPEKGSHLRPVGYHAYPLRSSSL